MENDIPLSERIKAQEIENQAEAYLKKYKRQIEFLESESLISKVRSVDIHDVYTLGKQLESFEAYKTVCEEDGSIAQLGKIPNIALDVITLTYGVSPVSAIASVQPIDEENGIVYFKNVYSQTKKGNINQGDLLISPTTLASPIAGLSTDRITLEVDKTVSGTTDYKFNLPDEKVLPYSVKVTVGELEATDNGKGILVGYDIQGTVDYYTGIVTVSLRNKPTSEMAIYADYSINFEESKTLPQIQLKLDNKYVKARVFALKSTLGLEQ
jgi:hypothetical protein